jgi:hypothetical protein
MKRSEAIKQLKAHLSNNNVDVREEVLENILDFMEQNVKMEAPKRQIRKAVHEFSWLEWANDWEPE